MIQRDNRNGQRSNRLGGWLFVAASLHVLWAILFVWVLWFGPFDQILPRPEWLEGCDFCEHSADAISTASQMGRLDVVSIALTILGVVIGVAALGSYALIRQAAMSAAQNEAYEWMEANIDKIIEKIAPQLQTVLPDDKIFILNLAKAIEERISGKDADGIAKSMED